MSNNQARYMDGNTSKIHDVLLMFSPRGIKIIALENNEIFDAWNYDDMQVTQDWQNEIGAVISHKRHYGAGITIDNRGLFNFICDKLPRKHRATFIIPINFSYILIFMVLSVLFVITAIPIYGKLMDGAANFISPEMEQKLGDLQLSLITEEFKPCEDKFAKDKLQKIVERLVDNSNLKGQKINIHLYNDKMVNAFAMAGNNMIILTGFLNATKNENEIAGVLAHELGHISGRDSLRLALRSQGYALLSFLISGSNDTYSKLASIGGMLKTLEYSRDKERSADDFAANILPRAKYSTDGLINFLKFNINDGKDIEENLNFLSTHPITAERVKHLQENYKNSKAWSPILNQDEFTKLKNICSK